MPSGPLLLFNTYKSPRTDSFDRPSMDRLLAAAPRVLVVGDLNCKHTSWGCRSNNTAGNQLHGYLTQADCAIIAPDEPTRTDPRDGGQSTLDIGIVHRVEHLVTAETLDCIGSDHAPVLFTVHTTPYHTEAPRRFNYTRARWPAFQQHLQANLKIRRFKTEAELKAVAAAAPIIGGFVVKWEQYKNKGEVPQCYNCQDLFHTSRQCGREVRCRKCSRPHRSSECDATATRCANCGKGHPSTYRGCKYYQEQLQERWRLRINNSKTEPILFSKRRVTGEEYHHLRIDGAPLPWKEKVRFLGVHLDRRLNLRAHLTAIKKNARAAMSILYPLINRRSKLSTNMKVRLANAYIRPILTYAAPAWAGMLADTNLHSLQVTQNKYLRLALNKPRHTRIRDLHTQAQTTHIGDFIVKSLRAFYAKATANNNPLIAGLGQYTPENTPNCRTHRTPMHRLFQLDE
ncbi:hypothetical protein FOCC_FOCC017104 [Frankliniella occidentalis]|nr:hypothetical protein FOCC_FOCC017104 [Frankliniella occidentalis]